MTKLEKLMKLNGIRSMKRELDTANAIGQDLLEIRQGLSDLEDAIIELAELLTEDE